MIILIYLLHIPFTFFAKKTIDKSEKKMSKMVTQSQVTEETKSGNVRSSIITEYLDFNLCKMVNAWFRIDSRNEKLISENLTGPLVELLCQNYDC